MRANFSFQTTEYEDSTNDHRHEAAMSD